MYNQIRTELYKVTKQDPKYENMCLYIALEVAFKSKGISNKSYIELYNMEHEGKRTVGGVGKLVESITKQKNLIGCNIREILRNIKYDIDFDSIVLVNLLKNPGDKMGHTFIVSGYCDACNIFDLVNPSSENKRSYNPYDRMLGVDLKMGIMPTEGSDEKIYYIRIG